LVLVLGLGNPGARYERTRHNAGFLVVDRLAERVGADVTRKQHGALVGSAEVDGARLVLAKPQSYMNLSGQPAASLRGFLKLATTDVVVVHDEVDLPFGSVRLKRGGGHGGHNGLRDLSEKLGPEYARVRVGVSRPPLGRDAAEHVLANWTADEQVLLDEILDRAADAVVSVVRVGLDEAMNSVNQRSGAPGLPSGSAR
jgi:PTH1 family peptidyl-tRNA hydrolase